MTEQPPVETDRTEPIDLNTEMQRSYTRVRHERHRQPRAARRARRPQAGAPPGPSTRCTSGGLPPGPRLQPSAARVVGEVMGQYHPHGDQSIYDALVRLVQDWSLRYPLVQGRGIFRVAGYDPAAAPRYTECRMAPLAMGDGARTSTRRPSTSAPTTTARRSSPTSCPAASRTCSSTAPRYRGRQVTQIPPHNLREVAAAAEWVLAHPDANREEMLEAVMAEIKGPDFPPAP